MQILKTPRYSEELDVILNFIAEGSLSQAIIFLDSLNSTVHSLVDFPYKCRQSTKSDDDNVRDLVFKGYVIPYRINKDKNRLEIIGIFSANEWGML